MLKILNTIMKRINIHETVLYLIFGIITTLVNFSSYYIFAHLLNIRILYSTMLSWIIAVLESYVANKIFVFKTTRLGMHKTINELISYILSRLFTGILEWFSVWLLAEKLLYNDIVVKVIVSFLVVVINYVVGKVVIFKKMDK